MFERVVCALALTAACGDEEQPLVDAAPAGDAADVNALAVDASSIDAPTGVSTVTVNVYVARSRCRYHRTAECLRPARH